MTFSAELPKVDRLLFLTALVCIIIICVKMISYIVTLFLMSFILALLALPAMSWLKKRGLTDFSAVLVITCAAVLVILAFIFLTMLSFTALMTDLPQYQNELNTRLQDISTILNSYGISPEAGGSLNINLSDIMKFGVSGLLGFTDAVMFVFFTGVTTFFMLLEAPRIVSRMQKRLGEDSDTMRHLNRMTGYIIDFIVVRTETNLVHGILFGGFLGIIGVHGAILWGVLTFLLGYIPYFGLVIAAVPAIFFAWLQFGTAGALAVIAAVCILNLIVENPVYSFLAARKFEMPAFIVILSVIFWGWLLGLTGVLFAVPITLLLLLIFEMVDGLRWINIAIGTDHLFENRTPGDTGN